MLPQKLVAKILRDYESTKNAKKVAHRSGIALTTIYRILEAHDVERVGLGLYRKQARKLPPTGQLLIEYQRGDSLNAIAARYNCTPAAVSGHLKKAGATMRPRGNQAKKITIEEARTMAAHYAELRSQTAVSVVMGTSQPRVSQGLRMIGIHSGLERMRGSRHPSWKGGKILTSEGYFKMRVDPSDEFRCMAGSNGYAPEHRLVMARALGRPLHAKESVHHINGNKTDNRLSNLQLRFGKHGKGVVMTCAQCGSHAIKYSEILTGQ